MSDPYVPIVFESWPSTNTPITAERMNAMQAVVVGAAADADASALSAASTQVAAQDAAALVGAPADEVVATLLDNPASSSGARLAAEISGANFAPGQPGRLASILRRGQADAVLAVLGDSTGNEADEWMFLLTQALADTFPAYTVNYRLWADATQTYGAATTVSTGSGPRVLTVYNGSHSGAGYNYPLDLSTTPTRLRKMIPETPTAVVISFGYNSTTTSYRTQQLELSQWVLGTFPGVEYVVTSQPPKRTTSADSAAHLSRQQDTRDMAAQERWGLIDVTQRFIDYGNYDTIISTDEVHPEGEGRTIWAQAAIDYFASSRQPQTSITPTPTTDRILVPAAQFIPYAGTPAMTFVGGIIVPVMAFDGTIDEMAITVADVPPAWRSVHVDLMWLSPAAGATGAVTWQVDHYALTHHMVPQSGKLLEGAVAGAPTTQAVAGTAVRLTRVYTAERFSGGRPLAFRVRRNANSSAGDTSAQDALMVGLLITRAE